MTIKNEMRLASWMTAGSTTSPNYSNAGSYFPKTGTLTQNLQQVRQGMDMGYMIEPMTWGMAQRESLSTRENITAQKALTMIKKSVKQINSEKITTEKSTAIWNKIERLEKLGLKAQAAILEAEITLRQKLNALMEWDYKLLPSDKIDEYNGKYDKNNDKIMVHVDSVQTYIGTKDTSIAKDKVIPDNVLGDFEVAQDRKLFDAYSILWVEKVKDPLLLGMIDGCKDYFLIAEWGDDVKFDDIVKEK
jgi:hypothetical protein